MQWTRESKECVDKELWNDWFAWFPVCIEHYAGGGGKMVWLERVKRKGKYVSNRYGWDYKYKL